MEFATPLVPGRLIRRYKRFLADVRLESGAEVTAHCANPGAMTGLAEPGTRVWLEPNEDPRKKLDYGWRLSEHADGHFTGVDTGLPNRVVKDALLAHAIPGLPPYADVTPEVAYGTKSRVDFLLSGPEGRTYLEVKSVTLCRTPRLAEFPDTVTARGAKHLAELTRVAQSGEKAVIFYLVQRTDCGALTLARDIDPAYAAAMDSALAAGVRVLAHRCDISPQSVAVGQPIPFRP